MNIHDFYFIQSSILKRLSNRQALMLVPVHVRKVESYETMRTFVDSIHETYPEYGTSSLYENWKYMPGVLPLIIPTEAEDFPKSYLLKREGEALTINPEVRILIESSVLDAYKMCMAEDSPHPTVMAKHPDQLIDEMLDALLSAVHDDSPVYIKTQKKPTAWQKLRVRFNNFMNKILITDGEVQHGMQ